MSIPADAFTWTPTRDLKPGQLANQGGTWYLVVNIDARGPHQAVVLTLSGDNMGYAQGLDSGSVLTVSAGYRWRPILSAVPIIEGQKSPAKVRGCLLLSADQPYLHSWFEGDTVYAFNLGGQSLDDAPRGLAVPRWAIGLFPSEGHTPICELLQIDASPPE